MKHLQPRTLLAILAVLSSRRFSQRGLHKLCGGRVSIGLINRVVRDLQRKGFVERTGRLGPVLGKPACRKAGEGRAGYSLADPYGLLRYISLFRSMGELRLFTVSIDASEGSVMKWLAANGAVFCLGTAMERYCSYYRPEEISFYSPAPETAQAFLKTARQGRLRVSCYKPALPAFAGTKASQDGLFSAAARGFCSTTKAMTVLDLFCDGKGAYAKPLLKSLWGIEI